MVSKTCISPDGPNLQVNPLDSNYINSLIVFFILVGVRIACINLNYDSKMILAFRIESLLN